MIGDERRGEKSAGFLSAHEVVRDVVTEVYRAVQDSANFQPTIARSIDDEMASADARTTSLVNVGTQPPAIGSGGDFLECVPQLAHLLYGLLLAPTLPACSRG